jgi:hypothetical protein
MSGFKLIKPRTAHHYQVISLHELQVQSQDPNLGTSALASPMQHYIVPNNKVDKGSMVWFFRRMFCKKPSIIP